MLTERKMMTRISNKLHKAARLKAVSVGKPLSEVVRDLLTLWTRGEIRLEPLSGETTEEVYSRFLLKVTPVLNELGQELAKHGKSITTNFDAKEGMLVVQQGDLEKSKRSKT